MEQEQNNLKLLKRIKLLEKRLALFRKQIKALKKALNDKGGISEWQTE